MQEIIRILIIATIPVVGVAILFSIVRLCKILNQTNSRDGEISRLIQERDTLTQERDTLTQQIAHLTNENTTLQETTADYLSQWNETTSDIRQEITNIPKIYINLEWGFPTVSNDERAELQAIFERDYRAYLETPQWKQWAKQMKANFVNRCQVCNTPGAGNNPLNVHHRSYYGIRERGQEIPRDLTVLCDRCHKYIHKIITIPFSQ